MPPMVDKIAEKTGWTVKAIRKMLADAQVWSNELNQSLTQLNLLSGLNNYVKELKVFNTDKGKAVELDEEQLNAIYKSGFDAYVDTFEDFKNIVSGQLAGAGYIVGEKGKTTYGIADVYSNFIKQNVNREIVTSNKYSDEQIGSASFAKSPPSWVTAIQNSTEVEGSSTKEALSQQYTED